MIKTTIHVTVDNPAIAITEIRPQDIVIISGDASVWKYGELVAVALLKLNSEGVIAVGHGLDMTTHADDSIVVFSSNEHFCVGESLMVGHAREP